MIVMSKLRVIKYLTPYKRDVLFLYPWQEKVLSLCKVRSKGGQSLVGIHLVAIFFKDCTSIVPPILTMILTIKFIFK